MSGGEMGAARGLLRHHPLLVFAATGERDFLSEDREKLEYTVRLLMSVLLSVPHERAPCCIGDHC